MGIFFWGDMKPINRILYTHTYIYRIYYRYRMLMDVIYYMYFSNRMIPRSESPLKNMGISKGHE